MSTHLTAAFSCLREILGRQSRDFIVVHDSTDYYCLEAPPGPTTLRQWGGKLKRRAIPVAWVQMNKASVSYHLMGINGNPKLLSSVSKKLQSSLKGKACFNFTSIDQAQLEELEKLTAQSLEGMIKVGYIGQSRSLQGS